MELIPFVRPPLELRWADGDLAGLVVVIRRMSIGEYRLPCLNTNVVRLTARAVGGDPDAERELTAVTDLVADALVEWNLPNPVTPEGVCALDPVLLDEIIRQWVNRTIGVPDPLGTPSSAGAPFPEETIPMEVPSESPSKL